MSLVQKLSGLERRNAGGRLWEGHDGDDLAFSHFHDNLSLLVGKGLGFSGNDGLTNFQVFLRSEVGTFSLPQWL